MMSTKRDSHTLRVGQNRIHAPYMNKYLVISLPKIPYSERTLYGSGQPYNHCTYGSGQSYAHSTNTHTNTHTLTMTLRFTAPIPLLPTTMTCTKHTQAHKDAPSSLLHTPHSFVWPGNRGRMPMSPLRAPGSRVQPCSSARLSRCGKRPWGQTCTHGFM